MARNLKNSLLTKQFVALIVYYYKSSNICYNDSELDIAMVLPD